MSAQGSLVAVLRETSREVRELNRLLCTPHVSFLNVWQMEQNGRVAISDKMRAARQGGEWRWLERVCLCAGRSEMRESMSYSHQVARLRDWARRFSIGASNLDSKLVQIFARQMGRLRACARRFSKLVSKYDIEDDYSCHVTRYLQNRFPDGDSQSFS